MKTERVNLAELNKYSNSYTVRVELMRRGPLQEISGEPVKNQVLLLKDDQGNTVKGMLCRNRPQTQMDRLRIGRTYDITNARVVTNYEPWYSGPSELGICLYLNETTGIIPANPQTVPGYIMYRSIADLNRTGLVPCTVDIVGVLLFAEPKSRMVRTSGGSEHAVRDIVMADNSSPEPIFITTYDGLAYQGSPLVRAALHEFPVIGLSGLLTTNCRGFSLATGCVTTVISYPLGSRADALRNWAAANQQELLNRVEQLFATMCPMPPRIIYRIADLHDKMIYGLQPGERCWVRGFVNPITTTDVSAFTGCLHCEGPTIIPAGCDYFCNFCVAYNSKSTHCAKLAFQLRDDTGTVSLSARTEHSEALLRVPSRDIYRIKHNGGDDALESIVQKLGASSLWLELTATQLNRGTPLILWTLTRVEIPLIMLPTQFTGSPRGAVNNFSGYQDYMRVRGRHGETVSKTAEI